MIDNYDDIINLPHHESLTRKRMSISVRSAQFAPFSALTGYDEKIKETERLTENRIEIDEELKNELNKKLQIIEENIKNNPEVTLTYFVYDNKKTGGKYISVTGIVRKIDMINKYIILSNKSKIPIAEIIDIVLK